MSHLFKLAGLSAVLLLLSLAPLSVLALTPPSSVASDGPGAESYFGLARQDCVGTARNINSRVWYTVANGVLSDVYYPTLDNTNVGSLQLIVTDGKTFTDLQTRDTTFVVQATNKRALTCRVISTAKNKRYSIATDYITDPTNNTVVANVQFTPLVGERTDYQVYVRYDPTINGNGGGGGDNGGADNGSLEVFPRYALPVACDTFTKSNATHRTYAEPVCSVLATQLPFLEITNGFVGKPSDGLTQLDASRRLTALYTTAYNGNLVQTAQIDLTLSDTFMLALGFGKNTAEAVNAVQASLEVPFQELAARYATEWEEYDANLAAPPANFEGVTAAEWQALVDQYYASLNLIKASEDKTFAGALVAAMAVPWGQAVSAGDNENLFVGGYRQVFARDAYHAARALYLAGDIETARAVVTFLFEKQQLPDGSFPRNSLLNGQLGPESPGTQLDQVSYPLLLAQEFGMTDKTLYQQHLRPAANFILAHGPAFGVDRWEEQTGYSPSTIAAEIAALLAAAEIAEQNGDAASAAVWRGVADDWQRSVVYWTVTTTGRLAPQAYFIRVSKNGNPNEEVSYDLKNGGRTADQRLVVDAGFLEWVRLGILRPDDTLVTQSLRTIDATLQRDTPNGTGWLRYNGDGYGDAQSGRPWTAEAGGNGHPWPLLTAERGEYELAAGDRAEALRLLRGMKNFAWGNRLIPEQIWELADLSASPFGNDPVESSIGFRKGEADGSASSLIWSAGAYVSLFQALVLNKPQNESSLGYARYISQPVGQTKLTATASVTYSSPVLSLVKINGTTEVANRIYVAVTENDKTTVKTTRPNTDGTFNLSVFARTGETLFDVVAVSPKGATAHAQLAHNDTLQ